MSVNDSYEECIENLYLEMLREEIYSYLYCNAERCNKAFEF